MEIAKESGLQVNISESDIPVSDEVRGACEVLGLDPLYVANEGTMIAIVPSAQADQALAVMRGFTPSANSVSVGEISSEQNPRFIVESSLGTRRVVDMLPGEQLPRIC